MMKKIALLLAVVMLGLIFVGCDVSEESSAPAESNGTGEASPEISEDVSEPPAFTVEVPEIVPHPMTLKINSNTRFTMNTDLDNGKTMSCCWDKKSWGTWNIGSYKIDNIDYTTSATDWEYVFRASQNKTGGWQWSGGNHGNETLVELKIYDENDNELPLTVGETYEMNVLKVVERTQLHWGDPDEYFAEVVRTYTVAGKLITLSCTFDFVKDCYFYTSYTTMCPVSKQMGYRSVLTYTDGTTGEYLSDYFEKNPGAENFVGYYFSGNAAQICDFYPQYDNGSYFRIAIYNPEDMTDNFSNTRKTFVWDMSSTQNKVYFSRFDDNKSELVTSGTHWDTLASWEVIFEAEDE